MNSITLFPTLSPLILNDKSCVFLDCSEVERYILKSCNFRTIRKDSTPLKFFPCLIISARRRSYWEESGVVSAVREILSY